MEVFCICSVSILSVLFSLSAGAAAAAADVVVVVVVAVVVTVVELGVDAAVLDAVAAALLGPIEGFSLL